MIREKEEAENLAKELVAIAKQKYRDMAIAARRGASVISNTIRAGDIAASALGTGLLKKPKAGAGTEAQLAHRDAQLFLESAVIDEKISLRRQGMKDLEALMLDASDVALDNLKAKHAILAAQEQRFIDTIEEKARQAEEDKVEISRVGKRKKLQEMAGLTGEIGNLFGGMADDMSPEGEKGLEQNKSMLKAQAWAQAISASIGIFNNVANTPGLGPFAYAAAGAAMAATMVTLSAQIKKIDNPGGSSSTTISGGAFTALNANVTAERASNFQRSEDRRNSAGTQGAAASASNTEELLSNINEGIRTQKVVIDQATVADVERGGKTINTRRVQTSN